MIIQTTHLQIQKREQGLSESPGTARKYLIYHQYL